MYEVRLAKLVNGELVLGKYDKDKDCLNEVAILQVIPTQQGVQMLLLPYGHPFESKFVASIACKHIVYLYSELPKEIENKYIEAVSNITIAGGLGSLKFESQTIPASKLHL
ncbi:MAG: hypothetical protein IJS54_05405 [Desulfovibrio sp.]|nr:hypothetical protein [Desulfovibrio sp.]